MKARPEVPERAFAHHITHAAPSLHEAQPLPVRRRDLDALHRLACGVAPYAPYAVPRTGLPRREIGQGVPWNVSDAASERLELAYPEA